MFCFSGPGVCGYIKPLRTLRFVGLTPHLRHFRKSNSQLRCSQNGFSMTPCVFGSLSQKSWQPTNVLFLWHSFEISQNTAEDATFSGFLNLYPQNDLDIFHMLFFWLSGSKRCGGHHNVLVFLASLAQNDMDMHHVLCLWPSKYLKISGALFRNRQTPRRCSVLLALCLKIKWEDQMFCFSGLRNISKSLAFCFKIA
jgi:hypothetical protein